MRDLQPLIDRLLPELVALRHALHAHPELGFAEHATAARIAARLRDVPGLHVMTGVAGTGIVATLGADKPGPGVALRADMDALPMTEETGRPWTSQVPGCAHCCGHDGHVTCLVGAATILAEVADELSGPVRFIFQPAEEGGGGGQLMCEAGVLTHPPMQVAFALHAWPATPLGCVGIRAGPVLAATDAVDIVIQGRGTHAASPHRGVDPILIAAHVVTALQSVAARSIGPTESVVVTIGRIDGGTVRNVIPERVTLNGTIRSLTPAVRAAATAAVRRVTEQTALAFGGRAEVTITPGYPVTVNDRAATEFFVRTARAALGDAAVHDDLPVSMGGEDFAYFLERVPGALWRLGVGAPDTSEPIPLHSPFFDFPDAAIPIGVRLHCELARRFGR